MSGNPPPGVPENLITPQGNMPAIGIPNSQDYARLIFSAPYFEQIPIAEIIQPSVTEAVEAVLPSLVPPYVDNAVLAGVQQYAVLLTGSTMSGPLFLNPLMPTADAQAATKAYVDTMLATAGIPEVPPVPVGQIWGRETGQWTPIDLAGGTFLPITGGSMQGNINMSGNTLTNMAAVPAMPNGAAPAQWVLNQIASVSLYQGTWDADTNVPDLTQLSTHVNAYTWIAITTSPSGVVIGPAIPGLQGQTVFNGDTIIYSTVAGAFSSIHSGGITLPEADGRYVQLAGSQMSGALLLNANASQPLQATTLQQLEAAVANTVTPDAPADGQAYLRVGVGTNRWVPGMPLAGGIFTGAVTLAGPGAAGNNPVTVTQLNSAISGAQAGFMPIAGGTFTGPVILSGNATVNLNPVSLGQLNNMLGTYAPLQNPALTGVPTAPTATPATANTTQIATCAFVQSAAAAGYLPLSGGNLTGPLNSTSNISISGTVTAGNGVSVTGGNLTVQTTAIAGTGQSSIAGPLNVGGFLGVTAAAQINGNLTIGGVTNCSGAVNSYSGDVIMENLGIVYHQYSNDQISVPWNGASAFNYIVNGNLLGYVSYTPSDQNLKENFAPLEVDCLGVLNNIVLQQFDWKPQAVGETISQRPHWSCGFTAQELETLIPEAVIQPPATIDNAFLGVDQLPLVAYCIGAIQQLTARLSALEARA